MVVKVWTAAPVELGGGTVVQLEVSFAGERYRVGRFVSWPWQLAGIVAYLDRAAEEWVEVRRRLAERDLIRVAAELDGGGRVRAVDQPFGGRTRATR